MSLQNLLDLSHSYGKKTGMSEERVNAQMDNLRYLISFFNIIKMLDIVFIC